MSERSNAGRLLPVLGLALLLLMVAAAVSLWLEHGSGEAGGASPELAALSQRLVPLAGDALGGDAAAFDELESALGRVRTLARGAEPAARPDLDALTDAAGSVLAARDAAAAAAAASAGMRERVGPLLSRAGDVASAMQGEELADNGRFIERYLLQAERSAQDMEAMAGGEADAAVLGQRLTEAERSMTRIVRGLAGEDTELGIRAVGADAIAELDRLRPLHDELMAALREGAGSADTLAEAQRELGALRAAADRLYPSLGGSGEATPGGVLPLVLVGLSLPLLALLLFAWWRAREVRRVAEAQAEQNERNQQAILRLLDELGSLADGDLTVQATVTEDITGAIADSINYAIEALRELVHTINDSSILVDAAAKQTEATAGHLARASETQSRQVSAASDSISQMAASVEEVSGNAERASDVARHSVDVAHKGGDAVRRTIEGMNTIRETIQDTSKRIKRLGESSQEIGNIVELINDIAEQTNILALNASIQASMAGEAGRGFAVVADEVQRLAERSANATKQIEVLVRTIQSDTNEAVVSMERSTTDVVGGALLAENAGAALEEIEQVSNQIASLVQNISGSARQQTEVAADITRNMGVLRDISGQTAESTSATSSSIRKLSELATQLRQTVAGFRLPEAGAGRMTETQIYRRIDAADDTSGGPADLPGDEGNDAQPTPLQRQSG